MNILDYFTNGCGVILDQTTPKLMEKSDSLANRRKSNLRQILLRRCESEHTQCAGFTLTFGKKWQKEDPLTLHRIVQNKLKKSKIWNKKSYLMRPEFTSKNGNLHYHGLIYDTYDIETMRCLQWWRRTFGFVKPELQIRYEVKWIDYILKDYKKSGLWTLHNNILENTDINNTLFASVVAGSNSNA